MLSRESHVLLLLCSHVGLAKESDLVPLTLREWNLLARKIKASKFVHPEELLGQTVTTIKKQLDLTETEAKRLVGLLERNDDFVSELDRLASQGIRVMTRAESDYPQRYLQRLKESAPTVLFYSGDGALMGQPGIAVVGSRHLDQAGQECATFVGNACGLSGLVLYSGGARGVDTLCMKAALEARGSAVGILADSLQKAIRDSETQSAISRGDLCLVTPNSPDAGFSVGAAMGRNRLIYCLADYAIVVASNAEKGGTWVGATEALKSGWIPDFILEHETMPDGNRRLLKMGGLTFPHPFPEHYSKLPGLLLENSVPSKPKTSQLSLF